MQNINIGDATSVSIPQAHSDLTGMVPQAAIPALGVATATTLNGLTVTSSTGTLTITSGKTLSVSNSLTLAGTDGTVMTFPSSSASIARTDAGNTFIGHQTIEGVTSTGATGTGLLTFSISPSFTGTVGAAAITATGTVQAATLTSTGGINAGTTKFAVNSSGVATEYNSIALTGNGIPTEVGIVTTGTASAAIAATNLLAAPVAAGMYRITCYLKITVATTSPVAGAVTLTYADKDGVAQSVVMSMQNAAGALATQTGSTTTTPIMGCTEIWCNSGTAIKYAIAFSGTGTYEYNFKVEAL